MKPLVTLRQALEDPSCLEHLWQALHGTLGDLSYWQQWASRFSLMSTV
jgi:hypothetical protein